LPAPYQNIGEFAFFFSKFAATCRQKDFFLKFLQATRTFFFLFFLYRSLGTGPCGDLLVCVAFSSKENKKPR
jgi:hypothetical protein